MPTNSYDLVVFGDDFAGLVAGALCARRGMRVLVLHPEPEGRRGPPRSQYKLGPHRLPVAPLALVGAGSPAIKRVLEELALDHPVKRRLRNGSHSFQFVAPDVRVDVVADDSALQRELGRELDEDLAQAALAAADGASAVARQLSPYLSQDIALPPTGFWERREIARTAGRIAEDAAAWGERHAEQALVRSFVDAPAVAGTFVDPKWLSPEARARNFHLWRQGAPRLRGDWAALREMFAEKVTHHNGEVRSGRVTEVGFSWGKITSLQLDSGEDIGAGYVIGALPLTDLLPYLEQKQTKRLAQASESVLPAGYRYTLNLVLAEGGVPEGMLPTVLTVVDPEQPLLGDNAFAVYVSEPDDEARVVVSVQAVCVHRQDDASIRDSFARLRGQLRERLELLMPFYDRHVLAAHSPYERDEVQGDLKSDLGEPAEPEPVWHSDLESTLGVTAVPYSVGIKNLSIASAQVLPGLGLEGLFTAGWCAAKLACQASGKKKDYLKNEVLAAR